MKDLIIYVHGKRGNAVEAEHYKPLFPEREVIGFDYKSKTAWEAAEEFPQFFDSIQSKYDTVSIIANSIGAFFSMSSLSGKNIKEAMLISPIVDMEKLITDMIVRANTSEEELRSKKEIETAFGETLSWDYLCYIREHPIKWNIPTRILYGEKDSFTPYKVMSNFAEKIGAPLTVIKNGEHWFHTDEQMEFLDRWIKQADNNYTKQDLQVKI